MDFFRRIFFVVVLSGAMAGLFSAAVQQWRVVPLILEAELYEDVEHSHAEHTHEETTTLSQTATQDQAAPQNSEISPNFEVEISPDDAEPWAPADGVERMAYTVLATTLVGLGFAFLLAAVSLFTNIPITPKNGLFWGLGGFFTFSLMPAIGLPPELPGMVAAELGARQVWWSLTAMATLASILAVVKLPKFIGLGVGLVLIILPHLVGAPPPPDVPSDVPAHLATAFAANALFASLAFWLVLGTLFAQINKSINKE